MPPHHNARWLVLTTLVFVLCASAVAFSWSDATQYAALETFRSLGATPYDQYRSILATPSTHAVNPITLYCDLREANDRRSCEAMAALFPLRVYDWTPQFAKHMRDPFLVLCPEFAIPDVQRHVQAPLQFVANPYRVAMTLLADSESPISSWRDVATSSVIVFEHHFSEQLLRTIAELLDMPIKILTARSYQDMYGMWSRGEGDILFLLGSHPHPFVANLSAHRRLKLLPWDIFEGSATAAADGGAAPRVLDPELLKFALPGIVSINVPLWYNECTKLPSLEAEQFAQTNTLKCEIKRYNVNSLEQYHPTYGFRMVLLATDSVSVHTTQALLRTLYQQRLPLYREMRWMIRDEAMVYCPPSLNFHAGARLFLEHANLLTSREAS